MNQEFKPGLYRHYTGHLYRAMFLAHHHETGVILVVYVPYGYPESGFRVRELCDPDAASWNDAVGTNGVLKEKCVDAKQKQRFDWVGP